MIILRNVLAVILGIVIGGAVNMALVTVGPIVIPMPAGFNPSDFESIKAAMPSFEPKHFVFTFLAHALGTLVGALIAYLIAGSYRSVFAFVIGAFFLVGGIAMCLMIPAPPWFEILDVVAAYIPMAWLGILIGGRITGEANLKKEA